MTLPILNIDIFLFRSGRVIQIFPAGDHEPLLASQPEAQPGAVPDLIAPVLHEQKEVSQVVGVLNGLPQIRLQHCPEGGLAPALPQPLNVAD